MGERLVIEIKRNDKLIATSYYHWSAYTEPAINILDAMYKHVLSKANTMTDDELQLAMIKFSEQTLPIGHFDTRELRDAAVKSYLDGLSNESEWQRKMMGDLMCKHGGLDPFDREFAANKFPDEDFEIDNVSRNDGLVAISESSMADQLKWSDGTITVDLDDGKVFNDVVYEYDIQSYLAETEDDDDYVDPDDIAKIPISLGVFDLNEIEIVKDVIKITKSYWMRYNNSIYQLKEG